MTGRGFPVLVAIDGSESARTVVEAAVRFCWPRDSTGHGVIARPRPVPGGWSPIALEAMARGEALEAREAARWLRPRWPRGEVAVLDRAPAEAILRRARALRAGAIVLGSRGRGALGRLVLGSVGRRVVRRAPCPALVVRRPLRSARRLLVGVDGSPAARRALDFVARLAPPPDGQVRLLSVVEPPRVPSAALVPASMRRTLAAEISAAREAQLAAARRRLEAARGPLEAAGWRVRAEVRSGRPLDELLEAARQADVLIVGARGVGGVERLLLGSVAEGALSHAPGSVLVVP
jgi:nucleotide-binding universal stress UspA family protein